MRQKIKICSSIQKQFLQSTKININKIRIKINIHIFAKKATYSKLQSAEAYHYLHPHQRIYVEQTYCIEMKMKIKLNKKND